MQASNIPANKFSIPWGYAAGGSYITTIPTASQIGITNGAASLTDGFVPLNGTPIDSGGVPPRQQDMNGILNEITAWNRWQQAGGAVPYDSTFQSAIGGYPNGATLESATTVGLFWRSTVDNNTTNPDTGGAGWVKAFRSVPNLVVLTASGTFTVPAGIYFLKFTAVGGGGGGGGCQAASSGLAAAANGGNGSPAGAWYVSTTPGSTFNYAIGAGGAGGSSGGGAGGQGGSTTIGGMTVQGGVGGLGGVLSNGPYAQPIPTSTAGISGSTFIPSGGNIGGIGIFVGVQTGQQAGGNGGASIFGSGGGYSGSGTSYAGQTPVGAAYGAGGGGACVAQLGSGVAGAAGNPGIILVEY